MTRAGWTGTLTLAVLAALAAAVAARARYTADLSAFLPRAPTASQRLLAEELRAGLASRLIMVAIEGADARTRAQVAAELARRLRGDPAFVEVSDGDPQGFERTADFLLEHRYLLSDAVTPARFTTEGLHACDRRHPRLPRLARGTAREAALHRRSYRRDASHPRWTRRAAHRHPRWRMELARRPPGASHRANHAPRAPTPTARSRP